MYSSSYVNTKVPMHQVRYSMLTYGKDAKM